MRVEQGSIEVTHRGVRYTLAPGDCALLTSTGQYDFLVGPGVYSQVLTPLRLFTPASLVDLLAATNIPSRPSVLNTTVWSAVDALIDAPEDDTPEDVRDQTLENLVVGLLTQVALNIIQSSPPMTTRSPLLIAALLYLEDHLGDPELELDSMAEALGTSPRTLHREFWAIGTSPITALREARLTAVAQRLGSKGPLPPLDALAQEYGYSDRTALTRAFRRRYGRSPLEHRRRVMPFPELA